MGRELPLDYRNESDREAAELTVDLRYMAGDLIRQINDRRQEFDAEAHIDEGLKGALNLHQFDLKRTSFARRVSFLYLSRADLLRWRGDSARALEDYKLASVHSERLFNSDRSDLMMKAGYAFTLIKVGEELNFQRRPLEAIAQLEIADKLYGELRQARPHDRIYRQWEWTTVQGLAHAYRLAKNEAKALELHHRKLKLANERHQASPEGVSSLLDLAESYQDYGDAHIARGNTQGGLENLVTARTLLESAVDKPNPDWRFLRLQGRILESIARANLVTKDYERATEAVDKARALRERDRERSGKLDPHGQAELAENRRLNASIRMELGQCAASKRFYEEAVALMNELVLNYDKPIPEWREQFEGASQALSAINATTGCWDNPVDRRVRDMIAMVTGRLR
jgi:tetratricopeptide (TPR) repeat protein